NLNLERRALKLALESEYEIIQRNIKRMGKNVKTSSNIGLDYMVYKIKDDVSNEEEYNYYKEKYGEKKVKKYYIDREPDHLYKY
ncbi:unnamed protein product, partial [marine sediment metagenome]